MYTADVFAKEGIHPEVACNNWTPVCPVGLAGPESSRFLYSFAGQCIPKSTTNITTPTSLEFINHVSIQIVLTIPTWLSCIRTIHIARQRKWKDRGKSCEGADLTQRPNYLSSQSQCLLHPKSPMHAAEPYFCGDAWTPVCPWDLVKEFLALHCIALLCFAYPSILYSFCLNPQVLLLFLF